MISVISCPSESKLGHIARADHDGIFFVGHIHKNLGAFPGLGVFIGDIMHAGKNYSFAVNGQTGKVVGEVPTDSSVSAQYFLKRAVPVAAGILLLTIVRYLIGG